MSKPVLHKQVTKVRPNYTRTGSLCHRLRTVADGMNLTEIDAEVTCKFCVAKISPRSAPRTEENEDA